MRVLRASEGLRVATAAALGAGAVASGFPPLNQASAVVSLAERPWAAAVMPSVVLALAALAAAVLFPQPQSRAHGRPLLVGAVLMVVAGALSVNQWDDLARPTVLLLTGLVAPLAFAYGLIRAALPRSVLCAAFLAATVVLLLRADVVFLLQNGLPTPDVLFRVKYSNAPYDFHYYSLGNPNYSSAFLIVPLALAAFWATDPKLPRPARIALGATAALVLANIALVFVRLTMLVGVGVVVAALFAAPITRRTKTLVTGALALCLAALASSGTITKYFANLGSKDPDSSGSVRFQSILDGLQAGLSHPLTGEGLGRYGTAQNIPPAHSSVVQAAADTGLLGLAGAVFLTVWICVLAIRVGHAAGWRGLYAGSAAAAALFCLQSAVSGGPPTWFASEAMAIWGLALGVAVAGARSTPSTEGAAAWLLAPARAGALAAWERHPARVLALWGLLLGLPAGLAVGGGLDPTAGGGPLFELLGIAESPGVLNAVIAASVAAACAAAAPLAMAALDSPGSGLAAPPLLLLTPVLADRPAAEVVVSCGVATGLLAAAVLARRPRASLWPLALALAIGAAILAQALRPWAGIPVLAATCAACWWTGGRRLRLVLPAALCVAFLAAASVVGLAADGRSDPSAPPQSFWTSAYYGIGWLENSSQIDVRGDPAAPGDAPAGGPVTAGFARTRVLEIANREPGETARALGQKAVQVTAGAIDELPLLAVVAPLALVLVPRRRPLGVVVVGTAAAALVPVLAHPAGAYEAPFVGALAALWTLAAAAVARAAVDYVRASRRTWTPAWPRRAVALTLAAGIPVAVASVATVLPERLHENPRAFYSSTSPALGLGRQPGSERGYWEVAAELPFPWLPEPGASTVPRGGARIVETNDEPGGYQLTSRPVLLPPGRYRAAIRGRVGQGGLTLVVQDARQGRVLAVAQYAAARAREKAILMGERFALRRKARVVVALANWRPYPDRSKWTLAKPRLERVDRRRRGTGTLAGDLSRNALPKLIAAAASPARRRR